ncbi:MAG: hypothetical protein VX027_04665 [Bacteroidota bacterium]|nr:hypothetical protein [Bacteroidota bacterium]MEC8239387.1 hypothetical protein [Bacteroidota bacterium]MEC8637562.1 hypothetical protein [Bacteroidota bacterium]
MTSCSQSEQQTNSAKSIVVENRVFFDNKPQLTSIPLGEEQPFTSLFAQLEELPNVDTNSLQQLLESIGDEADRISEKKFPDQLRIPQLLSRYKVFQTRLGIVRYTDPAQYADSTFVKAMDDVVISWNIFADHYNRFSTTADQAQVLASQIDKPLIRYKDRKRL